MISICAASCGGGGGGSSVPTPNQGSTSTPTSVPTTAPSCDHACFQANKEEFEAFDNDKHMLMKKENGKVISQQVTKREEKLLMRLEQ